MCRTLKVVFWLSVTVFAYLCMGMRGSGPAEFISTFGSALAVTWLSAVISLSALYVGRDHHTAADVSGHIPSLETARNRKSVSA